MTLSPEDLLGKFDLEFDAQALKTATREMRRKQFMDLITLAANAGVDQITQQPFVDMRKLWSELLDTFELPAEDVILNGKQVIKTQAKAQALQQQAQQAAVQSAQAQNAEQQGFSPGFPQAVDQQVGNMVSEQVGQNVSQEVSLLPTDQYEPPEAELLKESYQI